MKLTESVYKLAQLAHWKLMNYQLIPGSTTLKWVNFKGREWMSQIFKDLGEWRQALSNSSPKIYQSKLETIQHPFYKFQKLLFKEKL